MSQVVFGEFLANALTALGFMASALCLAMVCLALLPIAIDRLNRGLAAVAANAVALIVLRRNELPQPMLLIAIRASTGWLAHALCRAPPTFLLLAEAPPPHSRACAGYADRIARGPSHLAFPEDPHAI